MTIHGDYDAQHPLLADISEEGKQKILGTTFEKMVQDLAKPGSDIVSSLDLGKFVNLMNICMKVINRGNELDMVKKATVYNKPNVDLYQEVRLPSSQHLTLSLQALTAEKAHLLHMAVGLAGEAAEMLEQVVGHVLGNELDGENVLEEAGDASFYLEGLLSAVQAPLADAHFANKVKLLGRRYKEGRYSDQQAQDRADKQPGQ